MTLYEAVREARAKAMTPQELRTLKRWMAADKKCREGTATAREQRTEKALRRRAKAIADRIESGLPTPMPQA